MFFLFKQKTAYEMRISDWSSDVCSSDLNRAATLRAEAAQRRTDSRGWVVQRRERTRHLIELGGLVQKAGLVELVEDDRDTLYGELIDLAGRACGDDAGDAMAVWKRRGKRALDAAGALMVDIRERKCVV